MLRATYDRYAAIAHQPMPLQEVIDIVTFGERMGLTIEECAIGYIEYLIWDASPKSAECLRIMNEPPMKIHQIKRLAQDLMAG
jgi:hypothetical protein